MTFLPPPEVFGLPKKYTAWRKDQDKSIIQITDSLKHVRVQTSPTGAGKSLSYVTAGILLGGKVVILTVTKGLQSQLMRDFAEIGMVDIRGRNSYLCPASGNSLTCEEGPCTIGYKCELKIGGCPYFDAVHAATRAKLVVTNYSYWFFANEYAEGIGTPNVLVCDEAHDAPDAVANFLTIEFERRDDLLMQILPTIPEHLDIYDWKKWAVQTQAIITEETAALADQALLGSERAAKRHKILRRIGKQIESLQSLDPDNWVVNITPFSITFAPINIAEYAQDILLGKIRNVIPTSASVCAKTMEMLGLDGADCEFIEYPHTFPRENRMLIRIPGVRLNAKISDTGIREWVDIIDRIIKYRLDRKGIIHTVSYDRRNLVTSLSRHAGIMMTHSTRDVTEKVREFKQAAPPKVLVSPSMGTGWDFPYCLDPAHKILLADLTWKQLGDIQEGEKIAAFDEYPDKKRRTRVWREAEVTKAVPVMQDCYEVILDNGQRLVASAEHLWLAAGTGIMRWVKTKDLRSGPKIFSRLVQIFANEQQLEIDAFDRGYLAAAVDGEGYLTQTRNNWNRSKGEMPATMLGFTQVENAMFYKMLELLTKNNYHPKLYVTTRGKHVNWQPKYNLILVQRAEILRFLASVRPTRLLPKFDWAFVGSLRTQKTHKVVNLHKLGTREVLALATTSKTFVTDGGLATHNSQCEYQIIGKIAYPDTRNKITKARCDADPEYAPYIAMQNLVQTCGRGVRSETDHCENFLIDDNSSWFIPRFSHFAPKWFTDAIMERILPPAPPPKIKEEGDAIHGED